MGTTTTLRVTSEGVDPRMLFLRARQAVGIPDEWPFEHDDRDSGGAVNVVRSVPGGFDAAVGSYWNAYEAVPWDDEDTGPPCHADVWWDTSPSVNVQHGRYVAEVAAWLDSIGVTWAVECNGDGWEDTGSQ